MRKGKRLHERGILQAGGLFLYPWDVAPFPGSYPFEYCMKSFSYPYLCKTNVTHIMMNCSSVILYLK